MIGLVNVLLVRVSVRLVVARVDVVSGKVTAASSANEAGVLKVTLLVPFPEASKNSIPAALAPFLTVKFPAVVKVLLNVVAPLIATVPFATIAKIPLLDWLI